MGIRVTTCYETRARAEPEAQKSWNMVVKCSGTCMTGQVVGSQVPGDCMHHRMTDAKGEHVSGWGGHLVVGREQVGGQGAGIRPLDSFTSCSLGAACPTSIVGAGEFGGVNF